MLQLLGSNSSGEGNGNLPSADFVAVNWDG